MKDYYKILGIRANASGEDIRARWIELMRKFHPDLEKSGGEETERLREINEAYGILKYPSERTHYDLQRAYHRKKRSLYFQRLIIPPAILIVFFILGLIYVQRPRVALPKATLPSARGFINIKSSPPLNQTNEMNQINLINETNRINQTNQTNQIDQTNQPLASKTKKSPKMHKVAALANQPKVPNKINVGNETNRTNQINQTNQTNEIDHTNRTNQINQTNQINLTNQTNEINQTVAQVTERPLIATEAEVKLFLAYYRKRYANKDIDGFLSMFSPKAVQNGRDGYDEIEKIYSDFFGQSQELRYGMEDTRIHIFQNAVEVRARYNVDQILKKGGKKKVWTGDVRWILIRENGTLKIRYLDFEPRKSP